MKHTGVKHPIERHPRIKNGFLYRGLAVAQGTALHLALTDRDRALSDKLYDGLKADFVKQYSEEFWDKL